MIGVRLRCFGSPLYNAIAREAVAARVGCALPGIATRVCLGLSGHALLHCTCPLYGLKKYCGAYVR